MGIEAFLSAAYEGFLFNKDLLEINKDRFGYHQPNNLIFVTGLAGSGKTTQAHAIEKEYGARMLSTDEIVLAHVTHNTESYPFIQKAWKKFPDYKTIYNYRVAKQWDELRKFRKDHGNDYEDKLYSDVLAYICDLIKADKDHLYVMEGIHIFQFLRDYINPEKDSIIIRGESVVTAVNRYIRRTGRGNWFKGLYYELVLRRELHELFFWEKDMDAELEEFKKKFQYDH